MAVRPSKRLLLWLSNMPVGWWIVLGVAVVLGVSALFGGLDDADPTADNPPTVALGEPIVRDELTTVVQSLSVGDSALGAIGEPDEGMAYLVLTARVTNNYTLSTVTITDLFQFDEYPDMPPYDRVVLLADDTTLPQAHPGVPIDAAWVWSIDEDMISAGDTVRVSVMAKTLTKDGLVSYGSYWSDPIATAWVDVEVKK